MVLKHFRHYLTEPLFSGVQSQMRLNNSSFLLQYMTKSNINLALETTVKNIFGATSAGHRGKLRAVEVGVITNLYRINFFFLANSQPYSHLTKELKLIVGAELSSLCCADLNFLWLSLPETTSRPFDKYMMCMN